MTTEEIYNGNVEIAKMLGWVETTLQDKLKWAALDSEERLNNIKKEYIPILKAEMPSGWTNYIFPDFSTFDCSQDWYCIMNAVEFIETNHKYTIKIYQDACEIQSAYQVVVKKSEYITNSYVKGNKKQAVFIAVSQFAKMYNNKQL